MRRAKASTYRPAATTSSTSTCRGTRRGSSSATAASTASFQPAAEVFCRYFDYAQREEDIVLAALVRKTETIRTQLGSAGQVIEQRIADRLNASGIERGRAAALAEAIDAETDTELLARACAEMDDEERARHERLFRDLDDLWDVLERSRERVGVEPEELQQVMTTALDRAG